MKRIAWLVATAGAFALAFARLPAGSLAPFASVALERDTETEEPFLETQFASSGVTPSVHSASAVELDDGRLRGFWYGGSREGATDVVIYTAVLEDGHWGDETVVSTREATGRDVGRYVKKLGNPVVSRDREGRLWLFYVSVSVGGWSGSAINYRLSEDDGESWGDAKRLVTSPFLNLGTLVRGPAVLHADGSQGIPVYHEFLGKFGEYLRIDRDGRVLDKARMASGRSSLQPVVVPLSAERALAFLRSSGTSPPRVLSVRSWDGGASWSGLAPTSLANPDAAVAALRLASGELLMAFNDSEEDRSNLSLALSENDGDSWELVHVLAPPVPGDAPPRFAYPWLLESSDGQFHLLYTWNRERIVHVRFNRAWLRRNR